MITILILAGVTAGFAVDSDGAISEGEYDNQLSLSGGDFLPTGLFEPHPPDEELGGQHHIAASPSLWSPMRYEKRVK